MKSIINSIKNINDEDLRNYIIEAADNEGYINSSKIKLLDGEVDSIQFQYRDNKLICVLKLIDVILKSPEVGVEELGSVNLINWFDDKGWKYAF
jgi:hypothetical protein